MTRINIKDIIEDFDKTAYDDTYKRDAIYYLKDYNKLSKKYDKVQKDYEQLQQDYMNSQKDLLKLREDLNTLSDRYKRISVSKSQGTTLFRCDSING